MRLSEADTRENCPAHPGAWLYLEEITHRALNDYTAMLAIVRRASLTVLNQESQQALADVAIRLRAAAMTYQALRPPRGDYVLNLDRELGTLCQSISNSILSSRGIGLSLSSDSAIISAYSCWQISLVIFELIINAARHAFRLNEKGSIKVMARVCDRNLKCAVIDDGVCNGEISPGRGTKIVDALVTELGGVVSRRHSSAGSTVAFCIPLADLTIPLRLATARRIAALL